MRIRFCIRSAMRTFRFAAVVSAAIAVLSLAAPPAGAVCVPADDDRVTDEILLTLMPGASIDPVAARYGLTVLDSIPEMRLHRTRVAVGDSVDAVVAAMSGDPEIKSAEPHRHLENGEGVRRTVADLDVAATPADFRNQTAAAIIHAAAAHTRQSGQGITVAVLDTASELHHPETAGSMDGVGIDLVGGNPTAEVSANGIDDDGDGLIDETDQHGTHVAGLVHLAAPGARIFPIRVLEEDGKGDAFTIAKGILRAIDVRADVINLSFGMTHDSRPVARAIEMAGDAGIVIVAAAGNRGTACVDFPAYRPEVMAVAAVDDFLVKSDFSSYGAEVALSAPGNGLLSTYRALNYARWTGTSFATPLVAGAVALLRERYPGLTPAQVRGIVAAQTQPDANPPVYAGLMGTGVVDLDRVAAVLTTDRTSLKVAKSARVTSLRWSPVQGATVYDAARGDLANLRIVRGQVDLGPMKCLANDTAATDTSASPEVDVPAPGQVLFYLFRDDAQDPAGRSYGASSSGMPRIPGPSDCPVN